MSVESKYERIYGAVKRIPKGMVATYGQVARAAGLEGHARMVGYALAALDDEDVPWHRVVNHEGRISPRANPEFERIQRQWLEQEGVNFDSSGKISLAEHRVTLRVIRPRARRSSS